MRLSGSPRALVLPALAVLLPAIFIAVLAFRWISLEREASQLRGDAAASAALARLRTDLRAALAGAKPDDGSLIRDSFALDSNGQVIQTNAGSDSVDLSQRATRAAALLASAAEYLASGQHGDAARTAKTILTCCADARDEFGVSYALYASWQLATVSRRRPDITLQSVVVGLLDCAKRGLLDRPEDLIGVRALVDTMPGVTGVAALLTLVDQYSTRAAGRQQLAQSAQTWAATVDAPPDAQLVVAPWRPPSGGVAMAALRRYPSRSEVLLIDSEALNTWIADWIDRDSAFTFAIRTGGADADATEAVLNSPLFVETPSVIVRARQASANPATDRQRMWLFTAAAAAVLALTLMVGGLAVRDVIRERRLAALRATFLAGVTHEIKTPITSIRLLAETLQQGRAHAGATHELLGTIVNEAEHLSDLVDGLLSTSRIESGARTYRPRVVSLSDIVQAARRRCDYALKKEGFTLVETGLATAARVNVDPEALEQAVLNLIGNAMKYSGASRVIRLDVETDETRARVHVADAGVGVPEGEQSKIFTTFYRGAAASESTAGTGLGLALVLHFAEGHGGKVSVRSAPNEGSVFSVELPRWRDASNESSVAIDSAAESTRHG